VKINPTEKKQATNREPFLDYFRGIIILLMIQGHLFRALLDSSIKSSSWFRIHEYIHGVVAPGFLFLAGFLFYYTIHNKNTSDLIIKIRRLSGIVILGYFLHLPFFSLQKIIKLWGTGIEYKFLRMDILHTIGFSLLIAIFVRITLKRVFIPAITIIALFNVASPFFLNTPDNIFLASFIDKNISQFPLINWSFFLFLGILASRFLKKFNFFILIFSIMIMLTVHMFPQVIKKISSDSGKVLFLFSIVRLLPQTSSHRLKQFLTASRESLFLYISHLMIIYGSSLNPGLFYYFKESLSLSTTSFFFILLIMILYKTAYYLNRFKINHSETYNSLKYASFLFLFLVFILNKW